MADFRQLIPFVKKWEGGWSKHPQDKGGATMCGITLATFKTYRKRHGQRTATETDLKNISVTEWEAIYKEMYWDAIHGDEINNQAVANCLVSWVWGSGAAIIKKIQRLVGAAPDGIVGPKTIAAINKLYPSYLVPLLYETRELHFRQICQKNPSQKVFLKGWLNRLADLEKWNSALM